MTFSKEAWNANQALYETIRTMPFNQALADGKLTEDRFKHYIIQDAHYLIAFGRALAVAAAKADDPDGIVQFSEAAKVAIRRTGAPPSRGQARSQSVSSEMQL